MYVCVSVDMSVCPLISLFMHCVCNVFHVGSVCSVCSECNVYNVCGDLNESNACNEPHVCNVCYLLRMSVKYIACFFREYI